MTEFFKNRAPLDAQRLAHELRIRQCLWQEAVIKDEVTSTNDLAQELIKDNISAGTFVVANFQTNGRGRQLRTWDAPKNSSIFVSIILKPNQERKLGWIPLMTGLALLNAISIETRKEVKLKWPNDLILVENKKNFKFAGILLEKHDEYVIAGVGINYNQSSSELPISDATSLKNILSQEISKEVILASFISEFATIWEEGKNAKDWPAPSLIRNYSDSCQTLGQQITAHLPGGETVSGKALEISPEGELVLVTHKGILKLNSADIHLEH